jgi:hypothetical protein
MLGCALPDLRAENQNLVKSLKSLKIVVPNGTIIIVDFRGFIWGFVVEPLNVNHLRETTFLLGLMPS